MKKMFYILLFVFSGFFIYGQNADAIVGTYLKADGKSKVEFYKSGTTYSGKVVWLKEPNDDKGNAKKDVKNPDKSLRDRPLLGLVTITGLKYDGEKSYTEGKAYRPAEGDEVKFKVKIMDDGTINVTGSKYGFSKTETWKKQ
ncbi:MAG: DUF2147 domain-containing protein [Lentimicrobiaceae bacterium]|nr:DUF2147 domain-containing protein [Lentimicrobiaceae bacterium]